MGDSEQWFRRPRVSPELATISLDVEAGLQRSTPSTPCSTSSIETKSVLTSECSSCAANELNTIVKEHAAGGKKGAFQRQYNGICVTFENVSVCVKTGGFFGLPVLRKKKCILDQVTAYFQKGQLTALLGASGSGKTTLLDVISLRKNCGSVEGTVLVDGKKQNKRFMEKRTAYVEQFDSLIENLTVKEMLMYSAELKEYKNMPYGEKVEQIEKIIHELDLTSCQDTLIGSRFKKGISGGQLKRVSIGIGLIGSPRLLLLDEPTSGLDSFMALEMMSSVKSLAENGLTVCVTIHAPSSSIYNLFDKLMMLVDGKLVYFGLPGSPSVRFFSSFGLVKASPGQNEAEWLTSVVVGASRIKQSRELALYYEQSALFEKNASDLTAMLNDWNAAQHVSDPPKDKDVKENEDTKPKSNPGWWLVWCLLKYRCKADLRQPDFVIPRIFDKVVFGVITLTLYWGVGEDLMTIAGSPNLTAGLFMWTVLPSFASVAFLPSIIIERTIFSREKSSGFYKAGSYLMAKMIEEMALALPISLIFSCAVWFALSLSGSWACFWLVHYVMIWVAVTLAYFAAAISPNLEWGMILCAGYVVTLIFFAGILIRVQDIPNYWQWMTDINFLYYGWGSLMVNQFTATPDAVLGPFPGVSVLTYFNLASANAWNYLGYEAIFALVFFAFAWISMSFLTYTKR
eukprot:jgi/Picsp_1/5355/NSC_02716-R1_abc family transporter: multidrug